MKLVIRIAPFYLIIFGGFLFMILGAIKQQVSYAQKHYLYSRGYFKENNLKNLSVDYLDQRYSAERDEIFERLEQDEKQILEVGKISYKKLFYQDLIYTGLYSLLTILLINAILFTKVVTNDKTVKVYYPANAILGILARPLVININEIKSVRIERTTPFGPDLKDYEKINWRDNLSIDGMQLPGFVFHGLGKLCVHIVRLRPDIGQDYYKRTVMDNIVGR